MRRNVCVTTRASRAYSRWAVMEHLCLGVELRVRRGPRDDLIALQL
jgi:hypothetical protein